MQFTLPASRITRVDGSSPTKPRPIKFVVSLEIRRDDLDLGMMVYAL
jgi:hypothetical protein